MNKKIVKLSFIILFLIPLAFKESIEVAQAQTQGRAITIIPPKFELFANPGDTVTERIRVRNESNFPNTFGIITEDFSTSGELGQVVLEEEANSFSLAKWIEPESKELILQPNEEKAFAFTINIPRDAEPGGHYASILFSSSTEAVPGSASVSQRVGTLVLLRVSGNVSEDAIIETFEAPSYSQTGPIAFTLRVKNQGNVHIRPKGTIIVTNLFGKKVDEIPLNGANVIPGAIRIMETSWNKDNILGHYTATLVATYGQQNIPLTAAKQFTVMSTTVIILLVIGTIAGLLFLISLVSGRKRLIKALKVITSD